MATKQTTLPEDEFIHKNKAVIHDVVNNEALNCSINAMSIIPLAYMQYPMTACSPNDPARVTHAQPSSGIVTTIPTSQRRCQAKPDQYKASEFDVIMRKAKKRSIFYAHTITLSLFSHF